jgi:uncharacterized protein involved in exopolysaccharide biosynthesis
MQIETGLHSIAQFNEVSSSLILQSRRLSDMKAELERLEAEQSVLAERVGTTATFAAVALKVVADPSLAKLITDFADVGALLNTERQRLGEASPTLIQLRHRHDGILAELRPVMARLGATDTKAVSTLVLLSNNTHQADLFKKLVSNESTLEGRRAEVGAAAISLDALNREHKRLGKAAAELEDLNKGHLVAEAVFTTAMARLNTSKSDIYGSYPLLQTLSAPSLPTGIAGSQGLYALAGGWLGTFLLALAWFLVWLRTDSPTKRLKSA